MARPHHGVVGKSLLAIAAMFSFAVFAMPPLYEVFCEITGLNGRNSALVEARAAAEPTELGEREVKVQFIAQRNAAMPWAFESQQSAQSLKLGQVERASFRVSNTTPKAMVSQAIPSVSPPEAAQYLHKVECFCFQEQPLAAGESAELGLSYHIDSKLPEHIKTLTLSYTLFDITERVAAREEG